MSVLFYFYDIAATEECCGDKSYLHNMVSIKQNTVTLEMLYKGGLSLVREIEKLGKFGKFLCSSVFRFSLNGIFSLTK